MTDAARHRLTTFSFGSIYLLSLAHGFLWTVMPRHLEALGWSSALIGVLYGGKKLIESASMGGWASIAGRPEQTLRIVRAQLHLGALCLALLPWSSGELMIWLGVLGSGLWLGGSLPLLDTLSMHTLGAHRFGKIRAWGSFGYGGMALLSSYWGMVHGYEGLAGFAPWAICVLGLLCAAMSWTLRIEPTYQAPPPADSPPQPLQPKASWGALLKLLRHPSLGALLLMSCLHWSLMAPYNLFFVSLCEQRGLGAYAPGAAVALGICAEIMILWRGDRLLARWRPSSLFAVALTLTAGRWLLTGTLSGPAIIILQTCHGLSFGLFFLSAIALLQRQLDVSLRARGQASFYLIVFSLGSLIGESLTGLFKDQWGVEALFFYAGIAQTLLIPAALLYARWCQRHLPSPRST